MENRRNIILFIVCCCLSFLVTLPETRDALLALKNTQKRIVLGTLEYKTQQADYHIVKLQVGADIVIEIYNDTQTLVQVFTLSNARDAHFSIDLKLSNLFSANLDEDGSDEIIAPILDDNLVSHFSIIKYNADTQGFQYFQSSEL